VLSAEETNTAIAYGRRFLLKLYRRVEPGIHPEPEMTGFLTERAFAHAPALAGILEYRAGNGDPTVVATLSAFIENQGNAWNYTLDSLSQFFETALARADVNYSGPEMARHPLELRTTELPRQVHELMGAYLDSAHLMGQRTA
jgi:maltose alpha-D-glucosyltransferase/alpha-amylase